MYNIKPKAGEYHVWTDDGNWVAWFSTEEQASAFVARADEYEYNPVTPKNTYQVSFTNHNGKVPTPESFVLLAESEFDAHEIIRALDVRVLNIRIKISENNC